MQLKPLVLALALAGLAACDVAVAPAPAPSAGPAPKPVSLAPVSLPREERAMRRAFVDVMARVEPVAERECRRRTTGMNCDFLIVVDDRPGVPANAFQTVDETGRPVIAFTLALIADAQNEDELAFVMAHEAAHHIEGHLERQQRNATLGAVIFGQVAGVSGWEGDAVRTAQELGAAVGARTYSKDFELEADRLGAVIAHLAGFDPLRGAEFFFRVPDPGDRFLGTHPANADRYAAVQRVAAGF